MSNSDKLFDKIPKIIIQTWKTHEIDNPMKDYINKLKVILANEATRILHGEKASKNSEKHWVSRGRIH